jgi:hypothetical protein
MQQRNLASPRRRNLASSGKGAQETLRRPINDLYQWTPTPLATCINLHLMAYTRRPGSAPRKAVRRTVGLLSVALSIFVSAPAAATAVALPHATACGYDGHIIDEHEQANYPYSGFLSLA